MKIASSTIAMQSERTYTAIRQEVREEKTQYITENDDKAENVKQPSIADAVKAVLVSYHPNPRHLILVVVTKQLTDTINKISAL